MKRFPVLILGAFVLMCHVPGARAELDPLNISLSQERIAITTGFDGASLSLFGVKRQAGELAMTITGPEANMVIRQKERVLGIWANTQSVTFRNVPTFYDYAASAPLAAMATQEMLSDFKIGLNALGFLPDDPSEAPEMVRKFEEILLARLQRNGAYPTGPRGIQFLDEGFFRITIDFPPNIPTGNYLVSVFLIDDGVLIGRQERQINLAQEGFGATLYQSAYVHPLFYGLAAIFLAMFSGWGVASLFRRGR